MSAAPPLCMQATLIANRMARYKGRAVHLVTRPLLTRAFLTVLESSGFPLLVLVKLLNARTMEQVSTSMSEIDLARLLPTCQRCRRLRRKCDTQLPACRLCHVRAQFRTIWSQALIRWRRKERLTALSLIMLYNNSFREGTFFRVVAKSSKCTYLP